MPGSRENEVAGRLIVALDVASRSEALAMVDCLGDTCRWFKVGMELYYAAGRSVVEELVRRKYQVFLDLKLHDIPTTVAKAVRSVSGTGASLLTIHASGGPAMMDAAVQAASEPGSPHLLAVTVLTSMDWAQLTSVGIFGSPSEQVRRLAKLARSAGVAGIVCSAEEVEQLRMEMGMQSLLVTPGIRPKGTDVADQRRVATPRIALTRGASMLVVGRPITEASDPAAAARAILSEMALAEVPPSRAWGYSDLPPNTEP